MDEYCEGIEFCDGDCANCYVKSELGGNWELYLEELEHERRELFG